jgi:hypothetical protein
MLLGEVLVVLDLAQQDDLREQGLARELVNRWVCYMICYFDHCNMLLDLMHVSAWAGTSGPLGGAGPCTRAIQ